MTVKDVFLFILSLVGSLLFVILFISIGWYIVWKVFLSRFKFVRELLGSVNGPGNHDEPEVSSGGTKTTFKSHKKKVRLE